MSLQDKKSALFGTKPKAAAGAPKASSTTSSSTSTSGGSGGGGGSSVTASTSVPTKAISTTSSSSFNSKASSSSSSSSSTSSSSLPAAYVQKKIQEGRDQSAQAMKALETSIWQWSPDHLSAASHFESSGNAYAAANEYEIASQMYLKASESHILAKCDSSAADATKKAATMASSLGKKILASQLYKDVSDIWASLGDTEKMADNLMKAAKELEADKKLTEALEMQALSCERVCSMDTPKADIKSGPILTLECYKFYFNLLLAQFVTGKDSKLQKRLFQVAKFMCDMFQSFDLESSACKMMLTVTILQLHLGDVILAEQTMLNDHFGSKDYLASKECEVAEELIQSFKTADVDRLETTQAMVQLNYLEFNPVIQMVKRLSIFQSDDGNEMYSSSSVSSTTTAALSSSSSSSSSSVVASSKTSASNPSSVVSAPAPGITCSSSSSSSSSSSTYFANNGAPSSNANDSEGDDCEGGNISDELDNLEIEVSDDKLSSNTNDNSNNVDVDDVDVSGGNDVVISSSNSNNTNSNSNNNINSSNNNDDDDDDVDLS